MMWIFLAALCLALYGWLRNSSSGDGLYEQLALSPKEYRIIGHDLAGRGKAIQISAFGIMGKPDVLVEHRRMKRLRVYDLKSRNYKGRMTNYEQFQMTLYMGILKTLHPGYEVEGFIRYRNQLVPVQYSHRLFLALKDLKTEALQSISKWRPVNKTPLLARRS